jgi:hypothetical protein
MERRDVERQWRCVGSGVAMMRIVLGLIFSLFCTLAAAQGCGPSNPNCVVPTAPAGSNNNQAASTAFVTGGVYANSQNKFYVCTNTSADTTNINALITGLNGASGTIWLAGSTCDITSSILLGNGTSSSASSYQGVVLAGVGSPATEPGFPGYPASTGPVLNWTGTGAGGVVAVNGPLQGWGVWNLQINCNSVTASVGISVISAQVGETRNVSLLNCFRGYYSTTYTPFGSLTNTNSQHNRHYNTSIQNPAISGAAAVYLTGIGSASDTDYDNWVATDIFLNTTASTTNYGWYLQATDSDTIVQSHLFGGNTSAVSVYFDYSLNSNWPSSVFFFGVDPYQSGSGTQWANNGSTGSSAHPNSAFIISTNSAVCPTTIANLACWGGNNVVFSDGGTSTINGTFGVDSNGHLSSHGTTPTITSGCGGTGSLVQGTDQSGLVEGQTTAATTCTLSFAKTWTGTVTQACFAQGISSALTGFSYTTTTITVTFASTSNYFWSYFCWGTN